MFAKLQERLGYAHDHDKEGVQAAIVKLAYLIVEKMDEDYEVFLVKPGAETLTLYL